MDIKNIKLSHFKTEDLPQFIQNVGHIYLQKICEFQCMDCDNILVCSSCVASEQHGKHTHKEITEVYKARRGYKNGFRRVRK